MSIFAGGILAAMLALPALAGADDAPSTPPITCGNGVPGGVNCVVSKKERKEARIAFGKGVKLQDGQQLEEALTQFEEATRLVPQNLQYLTAREVVKAHLVFNHVERGNALLLEGARSQAAEEFRAALDLDSENHFARERLAEATREAMPPPVRIMPDRTADSGEIHLDPNPDHATFHFRGDVRGLFTELAKAYGLTAQFDDSVQARQVRFYVDDVNFFTALRLACEASKTMWSALSPHQLLIAADNPENHKQFDRMSLRTFILPPHSTPQEVTEIVATMRSIFDLHFVNSGQSANVLEVRGPQRALEACGELMQELQSQRPQVMLDVQILQIDHQLMRNIGLHIPDTFNLYNIPAVALAGLAGLGGQNIQSLINQLISSGGINQAGSSALSGLLGQLSGQNSIFSTPLATFGGGLTFMGLSLDQLTAALSVNESWVRTLEGVQMRAAPGNDATLHVGERYPIMNASYAPIYNSPQIAQVLGNQSYVPPFPSVTYEDLGLNLKAKPAIHADNSVSMQIELQVRSLTGQSNNGIPVISNQEYSGSINLLDGEPAFVVGEISASDSLSMSGIPGLGAIPLLNKFMATNTRNEEDDELLIVITPHVIANTNRMAHEIWLSEK